YSHKFLHIFRVLLFSLIFAYILLPIAQLFERYMRPVFAIMLLIALVILAVILLIFLFLPMLTKEVVALVNRFPYYARETRQLYEGVLEYLENMGLPHGM